jgi:hypothetical protein
MMQHTIDLVQMGLQHRFFYLMNDGLYGKSVGWRCQLWQHPFEFSLALFFIT